MKKQYIKLNNNDEHLSLGNLFRIIKDSSKNKFSALQSELFCILFDLESINDTTVNNYCVGCRNIGSEYKQKYLNKEKRYQKDKLEFTDNIIGILNIIDGVIYNGYPNKIEFINNNKTALNLAKKLYNLAKNDKQTTNDFTNKLYSLINDDNIYSCLVEELIFIVLIKKQPIYEEELKKEVFEAVLNDTSISSLDLQEYLSLKLREGINFDYSMKKLAEKGNAYANFELGSNEYYGYISGYPRYDKAFLYLESAAKCNHASANYMIGNMYIRGMLGSKKKSELEIGYNYLYKSYELGNIAACNLIGNMYLNGIYPLKKDFDLAKNFYEKASANNYAFAFNNLGKIGENNGNINLAFEFYNKAALLGESWACNKVGEFFRKGLIKKDMKEAFNYYNKALESNYRTLCYYAFYNLAKYFYISGCDNIVLAKDEIKAMDYFKIASDNGIIEASVELFKIYAAKYLKERSENDLKLLYDLKLLIEKHPQYNKNICEDLESTMQELKNKRAINMSLL